ncbi:MAG TPA: PepSY-like domain-containing protein, partial [Gemmataceae bacterium]|nr:PepSY-like domain-containing protein [Gemmataceae bacterium]
LPKTVVDAVKARFPDADLVEAAKEVEDGKTYYEIEIINKKEALSVELTPDGDLTEIEKEIEYKALPKAVSKALEEKYPKAEYAEVEEVTKVEKKTEKLAYFEVQVKTADKKKLEVQVDPDGKILSEEKKN